MGSMMEMVTVLASETCEAIAVVEMRLLHDYLANVHPDLQVIDF